MLRFFWPTKIKAEPGVLGRLGRVLHWILTGVAIFPAFNAVQTLVTPSPYGDDWTFPATFAVGFLLAGRVLRYILAGE